MTVVDAGQNPLKGKQNTQQHAASNKDLLHSMDFMSMRDLVRCLGIAAL